MPAPAMIRFIRAWRVAPIVLGWALATAGAAGADSHEPIGTVTLQFENDLFAGTDRQYTNGIRLSWLSPVLGEAPGNYKWIHGVMDFFGYDDRANSRLGVALGQEIYTPEDRARTDLITGDRPYAGWLYGAVSLHRLRDETTLDVFELDVGVVGPHAYGEEVQNTVHRIRGIDPFNGWDNQLDDEPGLVLLAERKWRMADPLRVGPFEADFVHHLGGSVGNVLTHVNTGGAVRLGVNLPRDFGPPGLIKGVTSLDRYKFDDVTVYVFASAEGRYVARNIFLDGNTFSDSHSVKKKRLVADLAVGIAFVRDPIRVAYSNALRTREFKGQPSNGRFGSISFSWTF